MKLGNEVKNSPFRKPIGVVFLCSHRSWSVHTPARGGRTRRSLPSPRHPAPARHAPQCCAPAQHPQAPPSARARTRRPARGARAREKWRARPAPAGATQRSRPREEARAMGHAGPARGTARPPCSRTRPLQQRRMHRGGWGGSSPPKTNNYTQITVTKH